jgi:hypothetical protein
VVDSVTSFAPDALAEALEANLVAFFAYLGTAPLATARTDDEIAWCVSGIPIAEYNVITRFRMPDATPSEHVRERVQQTIAVFAAAGVGLHWWLGPSTRPSDLGRYLREAGLDSIGQSPGMATELDALAAPADVPAGVRIERVGDERALRRWVEVAGAGYGEPNEVLAARLAAHAALGVADDLPLQRYLALLDGEPVAMSALFLGAGAAGLYEVATVEWARRRGIGAAVTCAAARHARALGYRAGVLTASPMGRPVYARLGFRQVCTFDLFSLMPETRR